MALYVRAVLPLDVDSFFNFAMTNFRPFGILFLGVDLWNSSFCMHFIHAGRFRFRAPFSAALFLLLERVI